MHQAKNEAEKNLDKDLHRKIKEAEEEEKKYYESLRNSKMTNLPPPPPPPPVFTPPSIRQPSDTSARTNLMDEIRTNNLKLKHVETSEKGLNLDITNMNKEERMDHAERLRMKLQMRKKALNRREASDD